MSEEIFDELAQTCANQDEDIPAELEDFVERHGSGRPELATIGFAAALALTSSVAFAQGWLLNTVIAADEPLPASG